MKRIYRSPQERFAEEEKGRKNEERFRHIFSNPLLTPAWISKVEHSGRFDDVKKGIDFYVYTSTGWKIPVDIKSSVHGLKKHVGKHGSFEACIIIMRDDLDDDRMREQACSFLINFQEVVIQKGLSSSFRI